MPPLINFLACRLLKMANRGLFYEPNNVSCEGNASNHFNSYIERYLMQYFINRKNIKQSIQNMVSFFEEKGLNIPRHLILEAFSKALFFKNYNTLEGMSSKPTIIEHLPERKNYMIEVEGNVPHTIFMQLIKDSFEEGQCHAVINNVLHDNQTHHIEISFPSKNDNFLTAMFLLASSLKSYHITRFDLLRIVFEKESLLEAVKLDFKTKNKV